MKTGRYGYCGCRNTGGIPTSKLKPIKNTKTPLEMFAEEFHSLLKNNMKEAALDLLKKYNFTKKREEDLCKLFFPKVRFLEL